MSSFFSSSANSDIPTDIRLSDTQLIADCPPSVQEAFRSVYAALQEPAPPFLDSASAEIDMKALNLRVKQIKRTAKREVMSRLKSVARQHDLYDSRLKALKQQLAFFRDDLKDQKPIPKRPTRFLSNFADDIDKMFNSLQRDITAYGNYLRPRAPAEDDAQEIGALIREESTAIIAVATELGKLGDSVDAVRTDLLGIARRRVAAAEADVHDKPSVARDVEKRFRELQRDIRKRAEKRDEEMSLFGELPRPASAAKSGSLFSFSGSTGFGTGSWGSGTGSSGTGTGTPPRTPAAGSKGPFSTQK
jgi:hypothetical protein